jgi:protein-L-isoaspartate(D-aspartate) O-methyltransferase
MSKPPPAGIDLSRDHLKGRDAKPFCEIDSAAKLPYPDRHFDLVIHAAQLA